MRNETRWEDSVAEGQFIGGVLVLGAVAMGLAVVSFAVVRFGLMVIGAIGLVIEKPLFFVLRPFLRWMFFPLFDAAVGGVQWVWLAAGGGWRGTGMVAVVVIAVCVMGMKAFFAIEGRATANTNTRR